MPPRNGKPPEVGIGHRHHDFGGVGTANDRNTFADCDILSGINGFGADAAVKGCMDLRAPNVDAPLLQIGSGRCQGCPGIFQLGLVEHQGVGAFFFLHVKAIPFETGHPCPAFNLGKLIFGLGYGSPAFFRGQFVVHRFYAEKQVTLFKESPGNKAGIHVDHPTADLCNDIRRHARLTRSGGPTGDRPVFDPNMHSFHQGSETFPGRFLGRRFQRREPLHAGDAHNNDSDWNQDCG